MREPVAGATIRYLSVCSGIEAATVAWHPLGWTPAAFSEIEAAPRAVLSHRWPEVPLHGDFTTIREGEYGAVDLLVGGTPCQSFSVAGLRGGLADGRGNLALEYLRLADRLRPRWLVWENVPGVLSSDGGRDFGSILGGMVELGYGFAYRVLDAQYVRVDGLERAVPQRRRRVFVVGHLGDWRRAAAVLLERACLRGDPAPGRGAGEGFASDAAPSLVRSGRGVERIGETRGQDPVVAETLRNHPRPGSNSLGALAFGGNRQSGPLDVATAVNAHGGPHGRMDFESETFVACLNGHSEYGAVLPTIRAKGGDAAGGSEALIAFDTTQITSALNRSQPQVGDPCHPLAAGAHPPAIAFTCKDHGADAGDIAPTLRSMGHDGSHANGGGQVAIAFQSSQSGVREGGAHATLDANMGSRRHNGAVTPAGVRRLTPTECERLQEFLDGYTAVPFRGKPASDGPRYKALGNSMATNVVRWIGRRIEAVEAVP